MRHYKDNPAGPHRWGLPELPKNTQYRVFLLFLGFLVGCGGNGSTTGNPVKSGPKWGSPVPITTSEGFNSFRMAMNKDGSVLFVYSRWDEPSIADRVYVKKYLPGSGWDGNETTIDAGESIGDSDEPAVAFDPSGSGIALALFRQGARIYSRWYRADSGWDSQTSPIDPAGPSCDDPQIAFDSSGNAVAVFRQGTSILARRYDATTSQWGEAAVLSSDSLGAAVTPRVAFIGTGNFMVTFYQWTDSGTTASYRLYAIRFDGSSWEPLPTMIDSDLHNFFDAMMTADGFGNVMVVFSEGSGNKVYARRYYQDWKTASLIGTSSSQSLSLSYDSRHDVTVLFIQKDGSGIGRVFAAKYLNNPGVWSEAAAIDNSGGNSDSPQITFDSSDHGIAVFSQEVEGLPKLFAVHSTPESGWAPPTEIDGMVASSALLPQIATDWNGDSMVFFAGPDLVSGQVFGVRYE